MNEDVESIALRIIALAKEYVPIAEAHLALVGNSRIVGTQDLVVWDRADEIRLNFFFPCLPEGAGARELIRELRMCQVSPFPDPKALLDAKQKVETSVLPSLSPVHRRVIELYYFHTEFLAE